MIATRLIQDKDIDDVVDLIYRSITILNAPDYHPAVISSQSKIFDREWVRKRINQRYMIVAEKDSKVVGTGSFYDGEIKSVYVDPAYAKRGVGREIMAHLEVHAYNIGYTRVFLGSSKTALEFYTKLGYILIEARKFETGGHTILGYLMEKRLL